MLFQGRRTWASFWLTVSLLSWQMIDPKSSMGGVFAANPFSSNVVALTPKNWRQEVEDSPHAVFVNICRVG